MVHPSTLTRPQRLTRATTTGLALPYHRDTRITGTILRHPTCPITTAPSATDHLIISNHSLDTTVAMVLGIVALLTATAANAWRPSKSPLITSTITLTASLSWVKQHSIRYPENDDDQWCYWLLLGFDAWYKILVSISKRAQGFCPGLIKSLGNPSTLLVRGEISCISSHGTSIRDLRQAFSLQHCKTVHLGHLLRHI